MVDACKRYGMAAAQSNHSFRTHRHCCIAHIDETVQIGADKLDLVNPDFKIEDLIVVVLA